MSKQTDNPHMDSASQLVVFRDKKIRRILHNAEWWFCIVDVVAALTDSLQPAGYLKDMRRRDPELAKGWGQIATPLLLDTAGGAQKLNCANTEGVFRIIQSIPSSKAEPFKRWLARVGYERTKEIEEVPKKFYIAYKLSQNFVCVEIKKNKLIMYLKVKPGVDGPIPHNGRDVSNIGHYGTGDFELEITNAEEAEASKEYIRIAFANIGG
ncbi:MAG: DUF5655 domain-containing protein [Candidatus Margulisbacteria bacterium]|jgi:predicted transport protein|nr:DUF5655 domain-containing protein [Candidatus Margulisiibacteriota bacterium]